jgi:hypothetical protein
MEEITFRRIRVRDVVVDKKGRKWVLEYPCACGVLRRKVFGVMKNMRMRPSQFMTFPAFFSPSKCDPWDCFEHNGVDPGYCGKVRAILGKKRKKEAK